MARIFSLIISVIYLLIAYVSGGGELFLKCLIFLLFPLACIWFGDELGTYTGRLFFDWIRRRTITSESPGWLVKFMGWILLMLPAIIIIFIAIFR